MVVAGLAALVVGALSLRTRGFFFLMVTLAFGQMLFFLFHDTKLGGGTDGAFLARPVLVDLRLAAAADPAPAALRRLLRRRSVLLVAMYLGLVLLLRSLFGRVLEGIRVNEHRMQALGFDTYRYKLAAFVIAGMLAGVAGHMWAMHRGFVNPELIGWHRSAEALLMILLGGLTTLHGPIVGALAYTALGEVCATDHRAQAAGGGPGRAVRGARAAEGPERHRPAALAASAGAACRSRQAAAAEARPHG